MTTVVNKHLDKYDEYIGRGSPFGNMFVIGVHGTREEVIAKYRVYFYDRIEKDEEFKKLVLGLKGKRLGCFCKKPGKEISCHGDIFKEYLDKI